MMETPGIIGYMSEPSFTNLSNGNAVIVGPKNEVRTIPVFSTGEILKEPKVLYEVWATAPLDPNHWDWVFVEKEEFDRETDPYKKRISLSRYPDSILQLLAYIGKDLSIEIPEGKTLFQVIAEQRDYISSLEDKLKEK